MKKSEKGERKLRVLHVAPAPFGRDGFFGGGERYSFELAKEMAKTADVRLLSFAKEGRTTKHSSGFIEKILGNPVFVRGQRTNPLHHGLFKEIFWSDIVHCHQTHVLVSEISALVARLLGKRVFTTDHGGGNWCLNGYLATRKLFTKHLHVSTFGQGLMGMSSWKKSEVIYGGVDTDRFNPGNEELSKPKIVFVGRIMPHKGIDQIIQCLPEGLKFEVIGRPYHREYFEKLQGLAFGKEVVFREDASDADIVEAYQTSRCVVLPSVYKDYFGNESIVPELLGLTLLEGMACGKPGLVTNVTSLPEIVSHRLNGWIVEPGDLEMFRKILIEIRDNPWLCRDMGEKARKTVASKFTWQKTVERCLAAYCG